MRLTIYKKGEAVRVLYDECDHELVMSFDWRISSDGYVVAYKKRKPYFMHRLIMKTPDGLITDHKNRIKHDNRRENLRICTPSENQANKDAYGGRKYRGVSFDKVSRKFKATIVANGRTIYLGVFSLEDDAARAYDSAAKYYFGEFSNPNIPGEPIAEYTEKTKRRKLERALAA